MRSEGGSSLGAYLVQISQDPALARKFRENPERAMAEAGLTEEERDLILSGSANAVRDAIAEELGDSSVHVQMMAFHWPITWPIVWP
jgi:hypothetical protein